MASLPAYSAEIVGVTGGKMTLTKYSATFLAFALVGLSAPTTAFTGDLGAENIRVHFAILLEHDDPISGDVTCIVGQTCQLLERDQPRLDLRLKVYRERGDLVSELTVRCENSCSFSNGRSTTKFFRGASQFDFFEGEDNNVEIPLVLKPREKIGRILLVDQGSDMKSGNVADSI